MEQTTFFIFPGNTGNFLPTLGSQFKYLGLFSPNSILLSDENLAVFCKYLIPIQDPLSLFIHVVHKCSLII